MRAPQDPIESLLLTDNLLTIQVVSFSSPLFDFFSSVYSKKHFTCLFVGFTFFFSGSEFLFSFLLHQICIDALHDGKNILFKQKQFVLINFLYRKFYITLSYFFQYYPLAIPDFSLYAWMCGKQNVKSSFIFLIAFTQQFSSLILHRP